MKRSIRILDTIHTLLLLIWIDCAFWIILLVGLNYGPYAWFLLVPTSVVVLYLGLLVHELAHFGTAVSIGLWVTEFGLWPLSLVKSRMSFRFQRFKWQWPVIGKVEAFPKNARKLELQFATFIIAAPLANLFLAIGALAIVYSLGEDFYSSWPRSEIPFWNRLLFPRTPAAIMFRICSWL